MIEESVLDQIRSHLSSVKVPGNYDRVYKDECAFTFDDAFSPGGLFISLTSHQAFGEEFVGLDFQRNGNALYLHEKWTKIPLPEEEKEKLDAVPEKLAIGGEGGFQVDQTKFDVQKDYALVVMPEKLLVPLPCPELPELILQAISAIQAHDSASVQDQAAVWEEERSISKYADNLEQLEPTRKIPSNPKEWKCDETGVTENLWLNLSTGHIGSGRQHWDGSGGNGAALRHYEATGKKYPLVVKLGTITPHGADIYSYAADEDDMVTDPDLDKHLAHWGINMLQMEKTEKTMSELQVEVNMAFEFNKITEAGVQLTPMSGPGYVGMRNLGNSCYMNSLMQVLWMLPVVRERYIGNAGRIFETAPEVPANDFSTQMAKLGVGLVQGKTGKPAKEEKMEDMEDGSGEEGDCTVRPHYFKTLVGKNHREFSTMHQQDANMYFMHVLEVMDDAERKNEGRLGMQGQALSSTAFSFQFEERLMCLDSNHVKYTRRNPDHFVSLIIPLEAALNKEEVESYKERELKRQKLREAGADLEILQDGFENGVCKVSAITKDSEEEKVLPKVSFSACLAALTGDEIVEDVYSAAIKRKTRALKTTRFATFPPFLMIQLQRYYYDDHWVPKKKEVLVELPDELDLEHLRGRGPQPSDQLQPNDDDEGKVQDNVLGGGTGGTVGNVLQPDAALVEQLVGMGFSENGCKRAAIATNNGPVEVAMEWVLAHMGDADFNDPLPETGGKGGGATGPPPEAVQMLVAMGFDEQSCTAALKACNNDTEQAVNWLLTNMDNLESAVAEVLKREEATGSSNASPPTDLMDGEGKYELVGFISHMGTNTACGHYVCHIKKKGQWVIFNDESVAASEKPPRDLGYMYMYKRKDIGELDA